MSGKWHLGLTPERSPYQRGFKRSFAPARSNHFAYTPELNEEQPRRFLEATSIPLHMEGDKYVTELLEGWRSFNRYGDIMLKYLKEWKGLKDKRGPALLCLLSPTAPHWFLLAPQYVYDDGSGALHLRRLKQLKKFGLVPQDVKPHPVSAEDSPEWEDITPEQKARSARTMECFAGMVECIDSNVDKVLDCLESIGKLDNTFACFMSDNGAEGAAYEAYTIVQTTVMEHLKQYYNNSLKHPAPTYTRTAKLSTWVVNHSPPSSQAAKRASTIRSSSEAGKRVVAPRSARAIGRRCGFLSPKDLRNGSFLT
ncbi:hypothetical protein jhhlp_004817 [Lomentospora prolificans]|uniref:Sulfatase N-terminal domain-containing protein n=1 Tax=Lomentospora prolificans TaxID=41688 RepID=A0A2N3N8M7_9PEZI|nr:hypothetical protein jhhlp_004817 [Lomentospora prolificans]